MPRNGTDRRHSGRLGMPDVTGGPDYARVASVLISIAARIVAGEVAEGASDVDSGVLPSVDRGASCGRLLDRGPSGTAAGVCGVPRDRPGDGRVRSGTVGQGPRSSGTATGDGDGGRRSRVAPACVEARSPLP